MTIKKNIVLEKEGVKPILVDFFFNSNTNKMTVIIFCHGYKCYKDWRCWNLVA